MLPREPRVIPKAVLERGAAHIHRNLALSRNVDLCIIAHPLALGVHPPRCHGNTKRFGAIGTKVENEANGGRRERARRKRNEEGRCTGEKGWFVVEIAGERKVVTYVSIRFSLRAPLPLCIPFPSSSLTPPSSSLHLRTFSPAALRPPPRGMPGDREEVGAGGGKGEEEMVEKRPKVDARRGRCRL